MEEPLSYRPTKGGDVQIFSGGNIAATLRGQTAEKFLAKVESAHEGTQQQAIARVTGNYRRGNERQAKRHQRNR